MDLSSFFDENDGDDRRRDPDGAAADSTPGSDGVTANSADDGPAPTEGSSAGVGAEHRSSATPDADNSPESSVANGATDSVATDGDEPAGDEPAGDEGIGAEDGAAGAAAVAAGSRHRPGAVRRRRRKRKRSKLRLTLLIAAATVVVLALGTAVAGYLFYRHLDNNVHRVQNVFSGSGVPTGVVRPTVPGEAKNAQNILLVGSDSRADQQTTGSGGNGGASSPIGQRSDTMMLVHIDAAKKNIWVVSIPRDSWVNVPGHGYAKINAAFSWGGPGLMVSTVEQLTGVRINHYAEIDFNGFQAMTDALGGVDVNVKRAFKGMGFTFPQGVQHMNGAKALAFVRNREQQLNADFDRINNQHTFMLALLHKALATSPFSNPIRLAKFLNTFTKNVSVDDTWSNSGLRSFVWSLRGIHAGDIQFLTVPYAGTGLEGTQSVVHLDPTIDATLWTALRTDAMTTWVP